MAAGAGDAPDARDDTVIIMRTIKPARPFQSSRFRTEIVRAANEIRDEIADDFQRTVATWKHKPKFEGKIATGAGAGGVTITVTPNPEKPYVFVDKGTRVRRALMSRDFKAKTIPDVVQAFPGRGHVVFISRRLKRPGIKARKFTEHIARTHKKEIQNVTKRALARFRTHCGHSA